MAWVWARIKAGTTRLGTFEGGFQAFAEAFAGRLGQLGVMIRLNTPVSQVELDSGNGLKLQVAGNLEGFDQVLVTTSPALLARLAPTLPEDYLRGLLQLKSMGAVVMILALDRHLSEQGYYWFNIPKAAGFPFLSLVEHTNFIASEHFGGDHLVYCGDYLDADHEYFHLSQEELLERFLPALSRFNPRFNPDWVQNTSLFRTNYDHTIPEVNHSRNTPLIRP